MSPSSADHAASPASEEAPSTTKAQPADSAPDDSADADEAAADSQPGHRIVVVTPDGMAVSDQSTQSNPAELIEEPAKVMRIGTMIKKLLEEVRSAPLDEAGRSRLAEIHERSLKELEQGLSPELVAELSRITLPFVASSTPSDAELRIAQAQLVGWLEGLFHGIQTALFAQQVAARTQLEQMRRALPAGADGFPGAAPGMPGEAPVASSEHTPGQYL